MITPVSNKEYPMRSVFTFNIFVEGVLYFNDATSIEEVDAVVPGYHTFQGYWINNKLSFVDAEDVQIRREDFAFQDFYDEDGWV